MQMKLWLAAPRASRAAPPLPRAPRRPARAHLRCSSVTYTPHKASLVPHWIPSLSSFIHACLQDPRLGPRYFVAYAQGTCRCSLSCWQVPWRPSFVLRTLSHEGATVVVLKRCDMTSRCVVERLRVRCRLRRTREGCKGWSCATSRRTGTRACAAGASTSGAA